MTDTTTPRPHDERVDHDLVERDLRGSPVPEARPHRPGDAPGDSPDDSPDNSPDNSHDSSLDRLARRVLGLRDAEPRALVDLQGSLVLSAVRCLITYVAIPVLLPAIAWAGIVARPIGLVLAVLAVGMSIRSLRRVWQANWTHRWAYTAFVAVVVGLLCVSIVLDVRFFLAA